MPSLQTNRSLKVGVPSVPKGKGDSCSWDGHARWLRQLGDSGGSPRQDVYLHWVAPGGPWHLKWQVRKWFFKLIQEPVNLYWSLMLDLFPPKAVQWPVSMESLTHYFTGPLTYQFEQGLISHAFLVVPECPTPILGRDLLGSLWTMLQLGGPENPLFLTLTKTNQLEEQGSIPSHILHAVNPAVWDKEIPGKTIDAQLLKISLKPEVTYPNKRQYPIRLEGKKFATSHR